jgi:hypothetical protein
LRECLGKKDSGPEYLLRLRTGSGIVRMAEEIMHEDDTVQMSETEFSWNEE